MPEVCFMLPAGPQSLYPHPRLWSRSRQDKHPVDHLMPRLILIEVEDNTYRLDHMDGSAGPCFREYSPHHLWHDLCKMTSILTCDSVARSDWSLR